MTTLSTAKLITLLMVISEMNFFQKDLQSVQKGIKAVVIVLLFAEI